MINARNRDSLANTLEQLRHARDFIAAHGNAPDVQQSRQHDGHKMTAVAGHS